LGGKPLSPVVWNGGTSEGKKSREGTVVDADDLMQEMYETAKEKAQELGKLKTFQIQKKKNLTKQLV
jgi:arginyl-tRNA synthetase